MLYKAVHLELVSSLDADAFIATLTRFVNLRADSVRHMYSDNDTNFVKADRELQEAAQVWQTHEVMDHLHEQSIQWHFNLGSGRQAPEIPSEQNRWCASIHI